MKAKALYFTGVSNRKQHSFGAATDNALTLCCWELLQLTVVRDGIEDTELRLAVFEARADTKDGTEFENYSEKIKGGFNKPIQLLSNVNNDWAIATLFSSQCMEAK